MAAANKVDWPDTRRGRMPAGMEEKEKGGSCGTVQSVKQRLAGSVFRRSARPSAKQASILDEVPESAIPAKGISAASDRKSTEKTGAHVAGFDCCAGLRPLKSWE